VARPTRTATRAPRPRANARPPAEHADRTPPVFTAKVTIDRARTGVTRIGAGSKIDNLVHIGHNVTVGKNCVIVAQVGVSGSTEIGNGVILAGQVGVKDHIKIGDGSIVCGQTGVTGDLPAGSFVSGPFARPHQQELRIQSVQSRLPDMYKQLKEMEARLAALEKGQGS